MSNDTLRILLIGSLFLTGYLLVLAWDADHSKNQNLTSADSAFSSSPPNKSSHPSNQDVPLAVLSPEHAGLAEDPNKTKQNTRLNVEIQTDTYKVWIDLHGGDLVRLELKQFPLTLKQPDNYVTLMESTDQHIYIAQSGLRSEQGPDRPSGRPFYKALSHKWFLTEQHLEVPLFWQSDDGVRVQKIYRFMRNNHKITLTFRVENNSSKVWTGALFTQIKRDRHIPESGAGASFGPRAYTGAAFTTDQERYLKVDFDDLDEQDFQAKVQGGWVAMLQHYFLVAWVPDAKTTNLYYGKSQKDNTYQVGFVGQTQQVEVGQTAVFEVQLYAGPKQQKALSELAENIDLTVDYGFLWWLSQPLFSLLQFFDQWVDNWGLAIIILTVLIKIVLYPLSAAAYRSMASMRRLAPELKRLQERYSEDRQQLSQEMMGLYRKNKVNPLGGCLPMLLQMPVFLALYWVLYESVELRQAPFILWITDLSVKDPWFVLPILMGGTMYLQQLLNPPVPDPIQARILKMMPLVFTVFFLFFPSGLVLYWLVNNVLSILQHYMVNRQYGVR